MAQHQIRYLERRLLSDGTASWTYNPPRDAKKAGILLTTSLGTDFAKAVEQAEKYNALLDGWRKEKKTVTEPARVVGSLNSLVDEYLKSRFYRSLGPATQRNYASALKLLCEFELSNGQKLGEIHLKRINRRAVDSIYEKLQRHDADGNPTRLQMANKTMDVACTLWNVGIRWEYVEEGSNPFYRMRKRGGTKRRIVWTHEELERFTNKAIEMGYRSIALAFTMQYELAQRQGDILNMLWSSYNGTHVDFDQRKTGKEMWLPVSDTLKTMLDATPRTSTYVVVSEVTKQPYPSVSFREIVRRIRDAAELSPELKSFDLRRTAATELGDAGATEAEIMSVGGWTNPHTVRRYLQSTTNQAGAGMLKRWNKRDEK